MEPSFECAFSSRGGDMKKRCPVLLPISIIYSPYNPERRFRIMPKAMCRISNIELQSGLRMFREIPEEESGKIGGRQEKKQQTRSQPLTLSCSLFLLQQEHKWEHENTQSLIITLAHIAPVLLCFMLFAV